MKTVFVFFALLFLACASPENRAVSTLSTHYGKSIHLVSLSPCFSNAPDSIEYQTATAEMRQAFSFADSFVLAGGSLDSSWIGQNKRDARAKYDSTLSRLLAAPRNPGFSLVRYTVNREPDTLTAVLDPSFRVVWPR